MTKTWPDPARPGVPLNPERDGWHWLQAKYYDDPVGPFMAFFWDATQQTWPKIQPYGGSTFHYLGPVLTPDEASALQKRVAKLEGALRFYADPFKYTDIHGDDVRVPHFYSETDFGETARVALEGGKDE